MPIPSSASRDRPEGEKDFEVTPEMIEAGVSALAWYSDNYESREDAVARIYRAMAEIALAR